MLRIKSGIRQVSWVVLVVFIMVLEWKKGIIYQCSYGKNQNTTNSISSPYWKLKPVCHYVKEYNSSALLEHIQQINSEEEIKNQDIFGPINNYTNSTIIVIQVHDRIHYLRHLINSLNTSRGIEKSLVIFSHDIWDEEINQLVESIYFTKVLQIFYPYSNQTYPHEFPGDSPKDCPSFATREEAKEIKCFNVDWPDMYGHYREAKMTQIKHHWWWKANQIFNELNSTNNFQGSVLFLEEDHYVTEDFVHILSLMQHQRDQHHPDCDILCLGTYNTELEATMTVYQSFNIADWHSATHNMGMALNRKTWKKIQECATSFCQYDDYNWDWSLLHVSLNCMKQKLKVMLPHAPRVFHIGECGFHKKKWPCNADMTVQKLNRRINGLKNLWFPRNITIKEVIGNPLKAPKPNGGWGDKRDHQFCMHMNLSQISRISMER